MEKEELNKCEREMKDIKEKHEGSARDSERDERFITGRILELSREIKDIKEILNKRERDDKTERIEYAQVGIIIGIVSVYAVSGFIKSICELLK